MAQSGKHLRQDLLTEQWVIYSPHRSLRPQDVKKAQTRIEQLPEKDPDCPFCPGNEDQLPDILFQIPFEKSNWSTRVVSNKYPALSLDEEIKGSNKGPFLIASADGRHEVIIETPLHNQDIPQMSIDQIYNIIETYVSRYNSIINETEEILTIVIFRNHGLRSGTSLLHPHSQLIAAAIIPKDIHDKQQIAAKYFRDNDRCCVCDIVEFERTDGARSIYENTSFLVYVPFAAEVPYEVCIVPKRHCDSFGQITQMEKTDLADALQQVLLAYHHRLSDPDYNYIVRSPSRQNEKTPHLHWYLQIRPRLVTRAGFEIGSGVHINPSLPEDDAQVLRKQIESQDKYFLELEKL